MAAPSEAQLKKILSEAPGELLVTHPVLNIPIHRGSDVELFSGDPSKPYVARIEDFQPGRGLKCRWYWRPYLDFGPSAGMPDIETATGRSISSFGASELLGGYKEDWNPPEAITALVKVLPIEEWLKLDISIPTKGIYYTRQAYSETEGRSPKQLARAVLAPDPKGAATSIVPILHLQVINPELRVYECTNCHKLYHPDAVPGVTAATKESPAQLPIVFVCGGCGADGVTVQPTEGPATPTVPTNEAPEHCDVAPSSSANDGQSPSDSGGSPESSRKNKKRKSGDSPQSQEKRKQVAEKFFKSLLLGATEMKAAGLPMTVLEMESEEPERSEEECLRSLATRIEAALYGNHGQSIKSKAYRAAYRTVNFNLSDPQNASLRRRVLTGEMSPQHLVTASHDELGSDSLQKKRLRQQEKYYKSQVLLERKTKTTAPSSPDRPPAEASVGQSATTPEEAPEGSVKPALPPMPEFGLPPSPDQEELDAEAEDAQMNEARNAEESGEVDAFENVNLSNEGIEEAMMMEVDGEGPAVDADMEEISEEALDELGSMEDEFGDANDAEEADVEGSDDASKCSGNLLAKSETRELLDEALKGGDEWTLEKTASRLKERVSGVPAHLALIETLRHQLCFT
ncbi:SPOC domain containing 1 [Perkinsus olseni]|uniref:SPOC domain containing 1 n=1 Tax=Perkinsus olseni TaxID=32597 RepID=A0A7J6L4C4_PEROL|nr:SPOC domain containing 1 [Perkinsus olseni]